MGDDLVSLLKSIETRLKDLETKETHVHNSLKELESKEKEMKNLVPNFDFCGLGESMAGMDAKAMLTFLNEQVGQQEKLHDGVYQALKSSEEPEKLVLDAVKEFYCENGELGIGERSVWKKRSCVILLEQLTRVRPKIVPSDVKVEAARLARDWRAKMRMEKQNGVLEVMGFLLLLGAYGLVDEFDVGELLSVFESIGQQSGQGEASELEVELGLADIDPESINLDSEEKIDRPSNEELQVVNQIASSFASRLEVLKYFCVGMDGRSLKLFLYQHEEEHDSMCNEVCDALSHASDPAKLVLDAIPGFLSSQAKFDKSLLMAKVRKSCILLLEQLITISPQLHPHVREEALKMADELGANLGQIYQRPVTVYGYLLFLAAYGLNSNHEAGELLHLLEIAGQYKASPTLCRILGLSDKIEVMIQTLIQKTQLLKAVDNIYAYELMDKFQPVRLLKGFLKYTKNRIHKKGSKANWQQDRVIDREIAVTRTVIRYIAKYKLESEYPPDDLEKQIVELENKKKEPKIVSMHTKKQKSEEKSDTILHLQVEVEPSQSQSEYSDNQIISFSTGPWPQLESFCISMDGRGSSFPSHEHVEEQDSMASSSAMDVKRLSPWPELKSFCINMDGKSLRSFLYNRAEEHDSICGEVCDALKCAPDPGKLVLDAIPGFLRLQPEFDKSLSLNKVRKSCILLLEQLVTISPGINAHVKEDALKMANEWRANLGQQYQSGLNVYGFLHFIAAYGFVSNYEADELLSLLATASQYKPCPGLCPILNLADKVEVIIQTLIQKTLLLEAVENIYAYELMDKFQPVRLLKGYLNYSKKRIYKKGSNANLQQAIDREIAVTRTVVKYIAKYKLESKYPPDDLEKQIVELENKKNELKIVSTQTKKQKSEEKINVIIPSPACASAILHPRVEGEPSQSRSEYSQLENQIISISTGGSSFLSHELVEDQDSVASSSTSPWPELLSFCINMDGKSLILFLYNHVEEHDSLCSEVYDALQWASDPAKLVLDVIPGFSHLQPVFDKSLSLDKVRKSCILLLEQLINMSPEINPHVKGEALKMANAWRANLGQKFLAGLNVYGFLLFIVAYGFVSNYETEELLRLLATANQYKASPGLCQILGLADKVEVLIENLIQKTLLLEAIEHIYAFEVKDKFQTVHLLEDYLNQSKTNIYRKGTKSVSKKAIDKEIDAVRTVIRYITKYKLESEYRPEYLVNYIVKLEKKKMQCK